MHTWGSVSFVSNILTRLLNIISAIVQLTQSYTRNMWRSLNPDHVSTLCGRLPQLTRQLRVSLHIQGQKGRCPGAVVLTTRTTATPSITTNNRTAITITTTDEIRSSNNNSNSNNNMYLECNSYNSNWNELNDTVTGCEAIPSEMADRMRNSQNLHIWLRISEQWLQSLWRLHMALQNEAGFSRSRHESKKYYII